MINVKHMGISVFLLMNFRIFQYFPGMKYVQELWYVVCAIFLLSFYPIIKLSNSLVFTKSEIYLLIMTVLITLMSILPANVIFGQPLIYGLLSMRGVFLLSGILMLMICLQKEIISFDELEKSFVILTWVTFFLYGSMNLLLNPDNFLDYGVGFVVQGYGAEKSVFKYQNNFLLFGMFYYFFKAFKENSNKLYLNSGIFFIFLLSDHGGRGMTLSIFITLLFFLYRWGGLMRILKFVPITSIALIILITIAYMINSELVIARAGKFADAFAVVLTGKEVEDPSANARLLTTLTALPYIEDHVVFGCGNISSQWNDGFGGVLGTYFHPSDIGLIGIVFMYGIVGLTIYLYQIVLAIQSATYCGKISNNHLIDVLN